MPPGEGGRTPGRADSSAQRKTSSMRRRPTGSTERVSDSSIFALPEGELVVPARRSVTARLALTISGAIAAVMVVFGIVTYSVVSAIMSRQIDEEGVLATRIMALPAYETWRQFAGSPLQGREAEFADKGVPVAPEEQEAFLALIKRNRERIDQLFQDDQGQPSQLGKLLDAVVVNKERTLVIAGKQAVTMTPTFSEWLDGVHIQHGLYQRGEESVPSRVYTAPVKNFAGVEAGWVVVTLSEELIQEKLNRLLLYIIFLSLLFLGLGVILSYYLGGRFTAPILALIGDVKAVARGDLDHRTRAQTEDEFGVLALTFDQMTRNLKAAQDAEREHLAQRHQMTVALEIQENLFPKQLPSITGLEIDAYHDAGRAGGGDFYDFLQLKGERMGVMIAASSGRGVPAAMVTSMVRSFLIATAAVFDEPADLLRHVNRLLSPDMRRGLYVTMQLLCLDSSQKRVVIANAGHPALIRCRAATGEVDLVHSEGIALGFDRGPVFDRTLRQVVLDLEEGDRLVLVTPSVFDVANNAGEKLGEARFYGLVAREASRDSSAFVRVVAQALRKYHGSEEFEGSLSFVTLRKLG
ncbi:MAG: SpoIIE family protein phosphatase [Planctomycetota bacterium]